MMQCRNICSCNLTASSLFLLDLSRWIDMQFYAIQVINYITTVIEWYTAITFKISYLDVISSYIIYYESNYIRGYQL
jgi:hypothetical protein